MADTYKPRINFIKGWLINMETNHYEKMLLQVSKENEKESFETIESICQSAINYMVDKLPNDNSEEDKVNLTEEQLFKLLKRLDNKKKWGFDDGKLFSFERKEFSDEKGEKYYVDEWCDTSGQVIELKTYKGD